MRPIISPTSSRALNWRSSLLAERQGYSDRLASPTDDLILFVESIITIRSGFLSLLKRDLFQPLLWSVITKAQPQWQLMMFYCRQWQKK
ncbi:hypothetical protein AALP_AA4G080300 [Arabis alpina]|uniref:Uncharacterized protein n=1 Tax=Arabis alpina TaxID=50452 RepID=A0A087H1W6_ARAAL|nr:hypothetical protein AALP_AA4G080300 [Arabis alpina]